MTGVVQKRSMGHRNKLHAFLFHSLVLLPRNTQNQQKMDEFHTFFQNSQAKTSLENSKTAAFKEYILSKMYAVSFPQNVSSSSLPTVCGLFHEGFAERYCPTLWDDEKPPFSPHHSVHTVLSPAASICVFTACPFVTGGFGGLPG